MDYPEIIIKYPLEWEKEFREKQTVDIWSKRYPDLLESQPGSGESGIKLFRQYALMYLLREKDNLHSITWYYLMGNIDSPKIGKRTKKNWDTLIQWMGEDDFSKLRNELGKHANLKGFAGEPDLFCWNQKNGDWFFAEAKSDKEKLTANQETWFSVFKSLFGPGDKLRIYRLVSD